MRPQAILLLLVLILPIFGYLIYTHSHNKQQPNHIAFTNRQPTARIENHTLFLELATTLQQQAQGLAGTTNLTDDYGMLFVYQRDDYYTFWMKGMLVPIDILWLNQEGKIVHLEQSVPPPSPGTSDRELAIYTPSQPARYVLEYRGGLSRDLGITIGDQVTLPDL